MKKRTGRVINITSVVGLSGNAGQVRGILCLSCILTVAADALVLCSAEHSLCRGVPSHS